MKNLSVVSKILLLLAVISGSLWFGSYFARLTASYQLFRGHYFDLAGFISQQNLPGIFISLNSLIIVSGILYIIFILTYFLFLFSSKISLKHNGWLFIITLLILVTLPFEAYLMSIDLKIYFLVSANNFNAGEVLNLYISRIKSLSSFPIIELLCYGAVIFFLLFQPLKKNLN